MLGIARRSRKKSCFKFSRATHELPPNKCPGIFKAEFLCSGFIFVAVRILCRSIPEFPSHRGLHRQFTVQKFEARIFNASNFPKIIYSTLAGAGKKSCFKFSRATHELPPNKMPWDVLNRSSIAHRLLLVRREILFLRPSLWLPWRGHYPCILVLADCICLSPGSRVGQAN